MKCAHLLTRILFVALCLPALLVGQVAPAPPVPGMPEALALNPKYNSLYCGGFITERSIEEGLFIMAGVEAGMQNEFFTGNTIFLNKGADTLPTTGGEYAVIRRVKDVVEQEAFKGQRRLVLGLGTMYAEVGRVRVNIVHEKSATAEVIQACEAITVGDFLIPFTVKAAPPMKPSAGFDRFAPATGKTLGMIVYGKEFIMAMGAGETAYLDIGANQNVVVGQNYRIFRPFDRYSTDTNWRYMKHYLERGVAGVRLGMKLTREQVLSMPRDVIGEMVITHVEGRAATALITFAQKEIFVGDLAELQ